MWHIVSTSLTTRKLIRRLSFFSAFWMAFPLVFLTWALASIPLASIRYALPSGTISDSHDTISKIKRLSTFDLSLNGMILWCLFCRWPNLQLYLSPCSSKLFSWKNNSGKFQSYLFGFKVWKCTKLYPKFNFIYILDTHKSKNWKCDTYNGNSKGGYWILG